jgi:hypothetical protein
MSAGAARGAADWASGGLPGRLIARLRDALTDPVRCERTAVLLLLGYVALWTLYGTLAKGSQDIHADMSEQFALSRELAWGYPKHPPLGMAVVRVWFAIFPTVDWAYYLLAMATAGLALWITWRLSARFLDDEKRAVGLALLTLVPFFNFHALKFNQNTVLLPLWAATTLWFLRSFETRRPRDAALAGLGAAACMYGKYWSIFLLLGLGCAALIDRRRTDYFRSAAPWMTIAVGALALRSPTRSQRTAGTRLPRHFARRSATSLAASPTWRCHWSSSSRWRGRTAQRSRTWPGRRARSAGWRQPRSGRPCCCPR